MTRTPQSIAEVVTSGLCIGCGLCEAMTDGRVQMAMTSYGALRPAPADGFTPEQEAKLLKACPGVIAEPRIETGLENDLVWGVHTRMCYAWAGDPDVRFRAATAGVLTALGAHLLKSGRAQFVLHTGPDPDRPMRSKWLLSSTTEQVIANSGSRYGPTAPLAGLAAALNRGEPFAIIAKPCDLGAVYQLSKQDSRVDEMCVARLAMVCGGQSRLSKSAAILREFDLAEDDLSLFRYRGYGNPGRTRIETRDGRAFEKTYAELWEDEAGWELETRCKLCPDALGETADVVSTDVWPGGGPVGEDAGFNGIIVRSAFGETLVEAAVAAGDLVLGETLSAERLNEFQPHQVRKKQALTARYAGLGDAGLPVLEARSLRLDLLDDALDEQTRKGQREGTAQRVRQGRVSEPLANIGEED